MQFVKLFCKFVDVDCIAVTDIFQTLLYIFQFFNLNILKLSFDTKTHIKLCSVF